jgi:hypothetical protein
MQFYKLSEILWNPKYPKYGKPGPMKRAWKELVQLINIDGMTMMTARHEVKFLRRRYTEKRKTLSIEELDTYKEKNDWFTMADSFLGPLLFGSITQRVSGNKLNQVYIIEDEPTEQSMIGKVQLEDNLFAEIQVADNLANDVEIIEVEDTLNTGDSTNMCRACLQVFSEEDMCLHSLEYTYVDDIQLGEIYKENVGYNNPEGLSQLPQSICLDCERLLLAFREFRSKCHSNESIFLKRADILKETTQHNEEATIDVDAMVDASYMVPDDFYFDLTEDTVAEVEIVTEGEPQPIEDYNFGTSKKFKCGDCGKSFTKSSYLIRHFRKVHNVAETVLQQLTTEFEQAQEKVMKSQLRIEVQQDEFCTFLCNFRIQQNLFVTFVAWNAAPI